MVGKCLWSSSPSPDLLDSESFLLFPWDFFLLLNFTSQSLTDNRFKNIIVLCSCAYSSSVDTALTQWVSLSVQIQQNFCHVWDDWDWLQDNECAPLFSKNQIKYHLRALWKCDYLHESQEPNTDWNSTVCQLDLTVFVFVSLSRHQDKDQRSLDMDTAKSMLALLLGRTWPLFPVFHQFLEVNPCALVCLDRFCPPSQCYLLTASLLVHLSYSSLSTRAWIRTSGITFWSSAGPSTQTSVTMMKMELVSIQPTHQPCGF